MSSTPQGPANQPEYLGTAGATGPDGHLGQRGESRGDGPQRRSGLKGRNGVLVGAAVAVTAVVGAGSWGAIAFLSGGGSQPADALPADTVGYVSVDLDPSATQKIEAVSILNKFPAFSQSADLQTRDDLRRWVFTKIQDEGTCISVDYDSDISPWMGERLAVAAVPAGKTVSPVIAVQVTDATAAKKGIDKLARCGGELTDPGMAVSGDYLLVAKSQARADALAASAQSAALADDPEFQRWTDAAGDPGIVTIYAAPTAPSFLPGSSKATADYAKDFEGMAGVVRFQDGSVEAEFASGGLPSGMVGAGDTANTSVTSLPDTTGAAVSTTLAEGWLRNVLDQSGSLADAGTMDDLLTAAEAQTGLQLPEDIEALLGRDVTVAVDSSIGPLGLALGGPTALPAGVKVSGDPQKILPIVEKLKALAGADADQLVVKSGDGVVAFGLSERYVTRLLEEGSLGDTAAYRSVVPSGSDASGVAFVNFDAADGWVEQLAGTAGGGDPEVRANLAPLSALGMSSWADGGVQHGLVRLTTD